MLLAGALTGSAQVCDPRNLHGVYGFQLSGTTTISRSPRPVASLGILNFDGEGGVSGTASVNFAGFLLGNPVTGTYRANADCSVTWSLQDDSGAFQHFAGTLTPDLSRATFRQTDPGGAANGTLVKTPAACSTAALQGRYRFAISGSTVPMEAGEQSHAVSASGMLTVDAAGNLGIVRGANTVPAGTVEAGSDCVVQITLALGDGVELALRGVLVTTGDILAIETDPGTAVHAKFTPQR
jgi:hypothetical protein